MNGKKSIAKSHANTVSIDSNECQYRHILQGTTNKQLQLQL